MFLRLSGQLPEGGTVDRVIRMLVVYRQILPQPLQTLLQHRLRKGAIRGIAGVNPLPDLPLLVLIHHAPTSFIVIVCRMKKNVQKKASISRSFVL